VHEKARQALKVGKGGLGLVGHARRMRQQLAEQARAHGLELLGAPVEKQTADHIDR
jgi:hypothetical protein